MVTSYNARNPEEISVNCGDRLHLVETTEKRPGMSLVRRIVDDAQGWIPSSCLRQSPVFSLSALNVEETTSRPGKYK